MVHVPGCCGLRPALAAQSYRPLHVFLYSSQKSAAQSPTRHACLLCLQVADLNALAELGKVYQDSLALSAQLRNLSSFRLQQDKVLGRGSLAVVQEGKHTGSRALPGQAHDLGRVTRGTMWQRILGSSLLVL